MSRILSRSGRFISITFAQPHFRKRLYAVKHYDWNIQLHTFGEGFHFFFYVMTKGKSLLPQDLCKPLEGNTQAVTFLEEEDHESYLHSIEI